MLSGRPRKRRDDERQPARRTNSSVDRFRGHSRPRLAVRPRRLPSARLRIAARPRGTVGPRGGGGTACGGFGPWRRPLPRDRGVPPGGDAIEDVDQVVRDRTAARGRRTHPRPGQVDRAPVGKSQEGDDRSRPAAAFQPLGPVGLEHGDVPEGEVRAGRSCISGAAQGVVARARARRRSWAGSPRRSTPRRARPGAHGPS